MTDIVSYAIMLLGAILLALILAITCGKRKYSRGRDCARKDPHIPGQEVSKSLRREIERRIERVSEIYYEPKLLNPEFTSYTLQDQPPHYFRIKAVDNMKYLEQELLNIDVGCKRSPRESYRVFLVNLTASDALLGGIEQKLVHELCDFYEHARHHPAAFQADHFSVFHSLLLRVLQHARNGGKSGRPTLGLYPAKPSSDYDSAIDEPDHDINADEECLIPAETNIALVRRHAPSQVKKDSSTETHV